MREPNERVTANPARRSQSMFVLLVAACLAVSLVAVAYPLYVIRPFRAQGARELVAALVVSRWRPIATLVCAIVAILTLVGYWRVQPRWWRRALAGGAVGTVAVLAVLARINVYELMFHPAGRPLFATASGVRLDGDEKVIAVREGREARAYPVRSMSYHHVINDVVDGKAIVATY